MFNYFWGVNTRSDIAVSEVYIFEALLHFPNCSPKTLYQLYPPISGVWGHLFSYIHPANIKHHHANLFNNFLGSNSIVIFQSYYLF